MRNQLLTTICTIAFLTSSASYANPEAAPEATAIPQSALAMPVQPALPVARNGEVIDSVGGGATEAILPGVESSNGINFITGGVGDEELAEMNAQMPNFNARLLISSKNGEYMSDVTVHIFDAQNVEILRVDNSGPFLFMNLPEGAYTYQASSFSGSVKNGKFAVSANPSPTAKTVVVFNE